MDVSAILEEAPVRECGLPALELAGGEHGVHERSEASVRHDSTTESRLDLFLTLEALNKTLNTIPDHTVNPGPKSELSIPIAQNFELTNFGS